MPNAKVLSEKQAIVAELTEKIQKATAGVIVDYKGITVEEDTALRKECRESNVDYAVVKNTLLSRALKDAGIEGLDSYLEGSTAIAYSENDYTSAAKALFEYADKHKNFTVKAGFIDGAAIDAAGVKNLADLPPKEVLIAKVLGGLNAPISGLANVLNGTIRGLAIVLNAIAEKQSA